MKKIYTSFFLFCIYLNATAQFSGTFAPAKWSTVLSPGSNGSINTSAAPTSITITGSNNSTNMSSPSAMNTDYSITVNTTGIWRFDWAYHTNDTDNDPQYDLAGVLINGTFTRLSVNTPGQINQSGTYSVNVTAGTTIGFRISATDNIMGDATFTITNFSAPASVLPITLISFTAKEQNNKALLQWRTNDESNISGFDVERSADGNQFIRIATVAARNLEGLQQYETIDATLAEGNTFYRLRIKERDGQQRFSPVAIIKRSLENVHIYPNPVRDNLIINFAAKKSGTQKIDVIDAGGRVIHSQSFNVTVGQNSLHLKNLQLAKGVYYLRTKKQTLPFTKE